MKRVAVIMAIAAVVVITAAAFYYFRSNDDTVVLQPIVTAGVTSPQNTASQLADQLSLVPFSSDPTLARSIPKPPQLTAFLYNSTPCAAAGKESTYRAAIRNDDTAGPAVNTWVQVILPDGVAAQSFSEKPTEEDPAIHSYFWSFPAILPGKLVVVDIPTILKKGDTLKADLIVTYSSQADSSTLRQVLSQRTIQPCSQ